MLGAWAACHAVLASGASPTHSVQRLSVSFSFGWRWVLGPGVGAAAGGARAGGCPNEFDRNLTGVRCLGLQPVPTATTPTACADAACAAAAGAWQLCRAGSACSAPCFVGSAGGCEGHGADARFTGAARGPGPPPFDPRPAARGFDDARWEVVDAPHDALIATPFSPWADSAQASIPKNVSWYRKTFVLPAEWEGSHVSVYIEGAFAATRAFVNGVEVLNHSFGYTSFAVRIDNATDVSWGGRNVIALHVDSTLTQTTGWWYEGGGLFRPTHLVRTSRVRVQDDSLFAPSLPTGAVHARATPADGLVADGAVVRPRVVVENHHAAASSVVLAVDVYSPSSSEPVASADSPRAAVPPNGGATAVATPPLRFADAELWSVARPLLYTVVARVLDADTRAELDAVNATLGVRSANFSGHDGGLLVNGQHVRLRGFCNHNSFGVVGVAVLPRINLLRMQQLRGLGANAWRMAHNPGTPLTYDLADALGVVVLDENRVASEATLLPSDATNLADMVRRDRQHPSVVFWSFCNEGQCSPDAQPTSRFKEVVAAVDGTKPVTANMFWAQVNKSAAASELLDIQGFSHQSSKQLAAFHALMPRKPVLATECCGCKSQRLEDADLARGPGAYYDSLGLPNPNCTQHTQWEAAYDPAFSAGVFTWTLHDYWGEPNGWPHVSSSHGQIDIAGFPKAASYWYRAQYLALVSPSDPGRPPVDGPGGISSGSSSGGSGPGTSSSSTNISSSSDSGGSSAAAAVVHIVETWQPSPSGALRDIHVYTSAPAVRLAVNGAAVGKLRVPPRGWALFRGIGFARGVLEADALDTNGTVLATHRRLSWGNATALVLSIDAPSPSTGTGAALYLDGSDVALLRATVVDAAGATVEGVAPAFNVTFDVVAGPGLVVGAANGDPASHEPPLSPTRQTYHGLARAVVRATVDAATPDAVRSVRRTVDVDAGKGPRSSSVMAAGGMPPTRITVRATTPGLLPATVDIPLSVDPRDAPLAVAAASVRTASLQ